MINQLDLDMYRSAIRLDEPFTPPTETELKQADREQILDELIVHLCKERNEPPYAYLDEQYSKRRSTLEGLLTVRSPEIFRKNLCSSWIDCLQPKVWRGRCIFRWHHPHQLTIRLNRFYGRGT